MAASLLFPAERRRFEPNLRNGKPLKFKELSRKVFFRSAFKAAAIPVAILAGGALVMGGSSAAFSGKSSIPDSSWKAATLTLSSSTSTALFNATLKPGEVKNRCITITSGADVPVDLKLYTQGGTINAMTDNMDVYINTVTGGTDNGTSCTGFTETGATLHNDTMSRLLSDHNSYATGFAGGTLNNSQTKQFLIRTSLKSTAPNTLQGVTTGFSFVFEIQ